MNSNRQQYNIQQQQDDDHNFYIPPRPLQNANDICPLLSVDGKAAFLHRGGIVLTYEDLRCFGFSCSQEDVGLCVVQSFFIAKLLCPGLEELIIIGGNSTFPYVTPEHLPALDAELRRYLNPLDVSVAWQVPKRRYI